MQIPKSVRVQGLTYKIKLVEPDEILDNVGLFISSKQLILIRKDLLPEVQLQTLFHEVLHAINSQLSETETEWLANSIYGVLKENKWLR